MGKTWYDSPYFCKFYAMCYVPHYLHISTHLTCYFPWFKMSKQMNRNLKWSIAFPLMNSSVTLCFGGSRLGSSAPKPTYLWNDWDLKHLLSTDLDVARNAVRLATKTIPSRTVGHPITVGNDAMISSGMFSRGKFMLPNSEGKCHQQARFKPGVAHPNPGWPHLTRVGGFGKSWEIVQMLDVLGMVKSSARI